MGLRTEKRVIAGLEVTTTQLPCRRAFALFAKVGRVIGPGLGDINAGTLATLAGHGEDITALAAPLGKVLVALDPSEAEDLLCEVLSRSSVLVKGKRKGDPDELVGLNDPDAIDVAFAGKFKPMLLAMLFALEVNFRDFFVETPDDDAVDPADEQTAEAA